MQYYTTLLDLSKQLMYRREGILAEVLIDRGLVRFEQKFKLDI